MGELLLFAFTIVSALYAVFLFHILIGWKSGDSAVSVVRAMIACVIAVVAVFAGITFLFSGGAINIVPNLGDWAFTLFVIVAVWNSRVILKESSTLLGLIAYMLATSPFVVLATLS